MIIDCLICGEEIGNNPIEIIGEYINSGPVLWTVCCGCKEKVNVGRRTVDLTRVI